MSRVDLLMSDVTSTFRDPQGRLFDDGIRILREVYPQHAQSVLAWIESPLVRRWIEQRRLVQTEILASGPEQPALLEHERLFFPSYPWEWTPGEWMSAGSLTLDLCEEALETGYILKDATPLNVLYSGPFPVFVDVLSFESRDPKSPMWIAYAQFVRTFLLPLAAYTYLGWPLSTCQQRRDGYEPADLAPWLHFFQRWTRPLRSLVTLPLLFEGEFFQKKSGLAANYSMKMTEEVATLALSRTVRTSRNLLHSLVPPAHSSRWSRYSETATHYQPKDHSAKQEFVNRTLVSIRPAHVLDVGANTGTYSRIAAGCGAEVVAWDTDVRATDLNWQTAQGEKLAILPLVADFARPTPAIGWRNGECAGLLSRAKGRFDCVLMLGILHHLLVADQIPLTEIIDQLAEISSRWAVLEWIPVEDSQFTGLCRGREQIYAHLTEAFFAQTIAARFAIRNRELLPNGRTLWLVERAG